MKEVGAGIDASKRLIAVARDRNPDVDLRVGDMHALPGADELDAHRGHPWLAMEAALQPLLAP